MKCKIHGYSAVVKSWQVGIDPPILHFDCVKCIKEKNKEDFKKKELQEFINNFKEENDKILQKERN
jgi:hypothetical protein